MNILILHYNNDPYHHGGAETVTADWVTGLMERGHQVTRSALRPQDHVPVDHDVVLVGTMHPTDLTLERTANALRYNGPSLWFLHDYWPFCPSRMCLAEHDRGCSATTGVCGNECGAFTNGRYTFNRDPWLDVCRDVIREQTVAVANDTTADMLVRNGQPVHYVLPLGIDVRMFAPGEKHNDPIITTSSAWAAYPTKGMHILKEACQGKAWGVSLMTGLPRTKVAEVLAETDIYVFPSCYEETWGLCLTEAMASGCACVASDVAGAKAQIEDGYNGVIVPKRNPEALAEAVERLIADRDLRRTLGGNARATVEQRFTVQHMAERFEKALMEVANVST